MVFLKKASWIRLSCDLKNYADLGGCQPALVPDPHDLHNSRYRFQDQPLITYLNSAFFSV